MGAETTPDRWPGDFLLHPVALGAIVTLIVNDWVIKARWPGPIAGKLSDIAGMVFFPLLLVALAELVARVAGRRWLAPPLSFLVVAVTVAVVFAATKTVEPVRSLDEQALGWLRWGPFAAVRLVTGGSAGSPVRHPVAADATDVLCAPFALVAVWIGARYRKPPRARDS
ncbi:MAG TPA: hypothetical protein PLS63_07200 [Microthrixaceae bacterium]|nr:hypothetical protein [Microthrixaceae bacterium]